VGGECAHTEHERTLHKNAVSHLIYKGHLAPSQSHQSIFKWLGSPSMTPFLPLSICVQYMATTGLLIAEVSINMAKDGHPSGGLIAMIRSDTSTGYICDEVAHACVVHGHAR
jgi:hypothetical protein